MQGQKSVQRHLISKGLQRSPLESKLHSFDDVQIPSVDGTATSLINILTSTQTDGLIFLTHGKIVYEYYGESYNAQSGHKLRSMTKSITGLATGILADQGRLEPDDRVINYIPELKGTAFETTTIRHCLDMTLGFGHENTSAAYRKAAGLTPLATDDKPTHLRQLLLSFDAPGQSGSDPLDRAPFIYTSIAADLLGWVLERASGMKFADLVSELLWQPLGAQSDANVRVDPAGTALAAAGMTATLRDMARVTQLMLRDNNGIVPPGWLHDMLHEGSTEAFDASPWKGKFSDISSTLSYRSNWIVDAKAQIFISPGAFGQMTIVDRLNRCAMVKFSSQPTFTDERKSDLIIRLFKGFRRSMKEYLFKEFQQNMREYEAVVSRLERQISPDAPHDVTEKQIAPSRTVDGDRIPLDQEQRWRERAMVRCVHSGSKEGSLRGALSELVGY